MTTVRRTGHVATPKPASSKPALTAASAKATLKALGKTAQEVCTSRTPPKGLDQTKKLDLGTIKRNTPWGAVGGGNISVSAYAVKGHPDQVVFHTFSTSGPFFSKPYSIGG